jgi:5,10-methylenetetrahydromethanopterin reductase
VSAGGPLRTGIWLFPDTTSATFVGNAAHCEAAGIDDLWVGDEGPGRDPFALLAAAAAVTARLRLAVGVTNPYLRHPAITAVAAMTVHELSGGRAVLGLGPGGDVALAPLGIDRHSPLSECRRAVRIIRAVCRGEPTDGYEPPAHAFTAPDLPLFIGARGERFNRFASEAADGVFVAGVAPSLFDELISWARSARPISIALYISACFDDEDVERSRPLLIHAFLNGPERLRSRAGLEIRALGEASAALAAGDDEPARALMTDERLDHVLVRGTPADVGHVLAGHARRIRPDSVGFALLARDMSRAIDDAAEAFKVVDSELAA